MARQHTSNIVWLVDDEKDGLDTGATIQKFIVQKFNNASINKLKNLGTYGVAET